MSVRNKLVIFIIVLLVLDQAVKIWIKTHMMIGKNSVSSETGSKFFLLKITGWLSEWNWEMGNSERLC